MTQIDNLFSKLKGGAGSGNFGHGGRKGKRGGSSIKYGSNIRTVSSVDDLVSDPHLGTAYYILKDGRIVDAVATGQDHSETAEKLSLYNKDFRVKRGDFEEIGRAAYAEAGVRNGNIQVRVTTSGDVNITTDKLSKHNLKKLQRAVDGGKLGLSIRGSITWGDLNGKGVSSDYLEFMSAKNIKPKSQGSSIFSLKEDDETI